VPLASRHDSHKLDSEGSSASQFFWLKRPTDETPGKLFDLLNLVYNFKRYVFWESQNAQAVG
jgi:hypothetical protein